MQVTRLAPSPTGALHLGNARTFLANWAIARRDGWRIILRIEDLDGPRVRPGADRQAIEDLAWLGIDWDVGPVYQSPRQALYALAVQRLLRIGAAYPCVCSRSEAAAAASAPHADDGAAVYPGTCRWRFSTVDDARAASGRDPVIRFAVGDQTIEFDDAFAGPRRFDVARQLGDFVIAKGDGAAAYQLAVVIDDLDMAVTQVVRGDDLIDSTPRQMLLYAALGAADRIPRYHHLPLVVGQDGRRLAKRHGDTRLACFRELGIPPGRVLALLGRWCGLAVDGGEMSAQQFLRQFDLSRLPRQRITFTQADDDWLRAAP